MTRLARLSLSRAGCGGRGRLFRTSALLPRLDLMNRRSLPRRRWFHATSRANLDSILQSGLQPRGITGAGIHASYLIDPEAVYLWGTLDRALVYGLQCQEMEIFEVRGIDPFKLAPGDEHCGAYLYSPHDCAYTLPRIRQRFGSSVSQALIEIYGSDDLDEIDELLAAEDPHLNVHMKVLRALPPELRLELALDCNKSELPVEHFGAIAAEHLRKVEAAEAVDHLAASYSLPEWRANTHLLDQVLEIWQPRLAASAVAA